MVFLNHGSFGACPRPVFEAYQAWQLELERQPVEFLGRRAGKLMREARETLGAFVGAAADDLVYIPNATTGVNILARSLPLEPGDEILATDHEYGAMDRTWRFICRKRSTRYIRQPVPLPITSAEQVIEAIWAGVTPRTRVLFLSHITSPTAVIFPVAELVRRARESGIITVVDGAHAPGQVSLDLTAQGVDFHLANCHKWGLGPKGSAFLYARREMQHLLEPLVVSWGWESDQPGPSRFIDEQEYQGTRDIAAYLAVPVAIRFMQEHDWPRVQQTCHELVRQARESITALTGLPPITPDSPAWFAQMAAFPLPPCDGHVLQQRLHDEFAVEIPITTWNGRQFVRISVQGYNSQADVDTLVAALKVLIPQVME
ncbi:MAG: aminotransferase class V-fold PLP-dependent enzyme [Chloroflexi bacterium]|nr:aminotransferase class V-fold PLP-dependent enzyme [Chloroflexota bacterium]MBU1751163.1 aminotransferase class V-fold PLP-dependent enzyme [Chloroflexota bacterium]